MSYQVLARKWRPQKFSDMVGQEYILKAIINVLLLKRIHHAYLFSGTRGVGKTTIARLFAKALNCEIDITPDPCCKCNNCCEIKKNQFVDLIEIDAASRTKVEDTRELVDIAQYSPLRGRFKIFIIDEVHMLSRHSFNALLKLLEEPPKYTKFLLVTTDPQKLPVTVLSRCLQFHLKTINVEQIYSKLSTILEQENVNFSQQAVRLLSNAANGSMRDALSLTDQAIGIGKGSISTRIVKLMLRSLDIEHPLSIIEYLTNSNGKMIISYFARCASYGIDWENLLIEILELLYRIAIGQFFPEYLIDKENVEVENRLRSLSHNISPSDLQLYYQILLVGRKNLPFSPNVRIGVEMAILYALSVNRSYKKKKNCISTKYV